MHRLFINRQALNNDKTETLHVYLDGDGTPWLHNRWKSHDPTSRNPLILQLLHQDDHPALLLGRPCYHGYSNTSPCQNKYWTSHRYSRAIVNSMTLALKKWLDKHAFDHIVLIGYSGGGVLALLMTTDIPQVTTLVTVAANLDVAAWSRHHHLPPLSQSLNPADMERAIHAKQLHIAGSEDRIVPPSIIKAYASQHNAQYLILPSQNHHCCWQDIWREILNMF